MAHPSPTAADGTAQLFGLAAAAPDAAIKQGWGHDGVGGGQAVANSTGYVAGGRFAVAILTEGPPSSYLAGIAAEVSAQAQALMAGVLPAPPPVAVAAPSVAAAPEVAAPERPTDLRPVFLVVAGLAGAGVAGVGVQRGARRLRLARAERRERLRRQALRRRLARAASGSGSPVVVRLPSGQLVRLHGRPPPRTGRVAPRPAPVAVPA